MPYSSSSNKFSAKPGKVLPLAYSFMGVCLLCSSLLAITQPLPYADNPLLMKATIGVVGLPLSIAIILLNLRKALPHAETVIIDERGITDRSSMLASGFTPWDDISEVYLLKLKSDTFLCFVPNDYAEWLSHLNRWQRRLACANVDAGFAPIRIQFKKVDPRLTAQSGLEAVKRFCPGKVSRTRKPKY